LNIPCLCFTLLSVKDLDYPKRGGEDRVEENRYEGIFNLQGGRILFDSPDKRHYLAQRGSEIYLVEETVR